ncbi:MAG TPA: ABC transporter permease [Terracidiphilus sp.]|jgi:predicted permease
MRTLPQDLRYALRQMRKAPGFTLTAVLTLALGMGATTAIFSLIQGALRLPFPQAERLISIKNKYPTASYIAVSWPDFQEWKRQNTSFSQLVSVTYGRNTYTGNSGPVSLYVSRISNGFFSVFGLKPIVGRGFLPNEEQKGASLVCVLSEHFWMQEFGGSQAVLGRAVVLEGKSYVVVGVVPDMVPSFFREAQVWLPLEAAPPYEQHGTNYLYVTGLLKPGVSIRQAQSDLSVIQSQIDKQFPANKHGIELQPLGQTLFGDVRPVMMILLTAVGFILLIACVNLANMMLARASGRMREFGIRQALGASHRRLVRQSLTESGLFALAGGLLGLAIAFSLTRIPMRAWPTFLAAPSDVHLSAGVLLFAGALVVLTTLIFGSAPAVQIVRQSAKAAVQQDMRTMTESREQRAVRSGLMVVEIAFATLLIGGAIGMAVYFARLLHTDPGVRTDHALSIDVSLSSIRYAAGDDQRRFFRTLQERLAALPGVDSAGGVSAPPFSGNAPSSGYFYEGGPPQDPDHMEFADFYYATPGYFKTMGVPLLRGRLLTERDTNGNPKVAMINQSMAAKLWPGQSAVGKRLHIVDDEWKEIVGVVGDVRGAGVAQPAGEQVYLALEQYPSLSLTMVLHTKGEPLESAEAAKQVVHAIDPGVLISHVAPVEALASQSVAGQSTSTALIGGLGVMALLLASIGVYGVMAYAVSRREREFGVRMALGAQRYQIYSMLLKSTGGLVGVGLLLGGLLSIPFNGWMRNLLGGTEGFSPIVLVGTAILLGGVALIATLIPSHRAASIDPMKALRTE